MTSQIGRDHHAEARLREAMTLIESALRDDPDLVMNLPDTAALYSDLATVLARRGQPAEARALFIRALDRLEQARTRAPRDARIRRKLSQTFAGRAEFLKRIGQPRESLADWDRALALAADADVVAFRLGRAASQALLLDLAFPAQPFARGD
jgi:tetratricopeptide (TPR) repeat protein